MELNLKNKYALVTGGSRGIGKAIALLLAEEGCNVAICARKQEEIKKTVSEIKIKGVDSIGVNADVTVLDDIERVVKTVINAWGTIHILVNNVGGGGEKINTPVETTSENTWVNVYNKNALAAIRFTMRVIPFMTRQKWGRVITISSIQGREGGGRPWYNMAKSAEISLMKTLAMNKDLSRCNITFNSIAPGAILFTDNQWDIFCRESPQEYKKMIDWKHPLGRLGTPEEIASVVAFLSSEKANLINGACIAVDGGESKSF